MWVAGLPPRMRLRSTGVRARLRPVGQRRSERERSPTIVPPHPGASTNARAAARPRRMAPPGRRRSTTLQRRTSMPYLTPPRVKLGTIACERAAAAVRRAARSPSAAPHVRDRSFPDLRANSKVGSLTTRESPPTRSLPKEPASRWPSLCTWPRSPPEKKRGHLAPSPGRMWRDRCPND